MHVLSKEQYSSLRQTAEQVAGVSQVKTEVSSLHIVELEREEQSLVDAHLT